MNVWRGLDHGSHPYREWRAAGEQHPLDALTIPAPLIDLVEIAVIGDQRLVAPRHSPRNRRRFSRSIEGVEAAGLSYRACGADWGRSVLV